MVKICDGTVTAGERSVSLNRMNPLIASYLTQLQAEGCQPSTIDARYWFLTAVDAELPSRNICDVLPEEIADYLAYPHWSPWTRATYYGHLASFYAYAVVHDPRMGYNPMAGMKRPRGGRGLPDPITDEQLEYAYASSDEWWKLVIALGANGGLRRAEIAALDRGDVGAKHLRVRHGKGDKARLIPTHEEDVWELVKYMPAGPLLLTPVRHHPVSAHLLGMMAREHFNKLGLHDVHLHRLRHYFATKAVLMGVPLVKLQKWMGHASPATTMLYVFIAEGQGDAEINTLPSLNGGSPKSPSARQGDSITTLRLPANVPSSATMREAS